MDCSYQKLPTEFYKLVQIENWLFLKYKVFKPLGFLSAVIVCFGSSPAEAGAGPLAGIISAVGVAILGAASSYFAYQKKKLCFKIQGGQYVCTTLHVCALVS